MFEPGRPDYFEAAKLGFYGGLGLCLVAALATRADFATAAAGILPASVLLVVAAEFALSRPGKGPRWVRVVVGLVAVLILLGGGASYVAFEVYRTWFAKDQPGAEAPLQRAKLRAAP